jgi:hypothetical protein
MNEKFAIAELDTAQVGAIADAVPTALSGNGVAALLDVLTRGA